MDWNSSATAYVRGGLEYPEIRGTVMFTPVAGGTMVSVDVTGLPAFSRADGQLTGPHGFHLHTGSSCEPGTAANPFPESGEHYNPTNQPHPNHAGDFPVLFSNGGHSRMKFFTDKLTVSDVVGKAVVIHKQPDDFRTQPSGNSGAKIACGIVARPRQW